MHPLPGAVLAPDPTVVVDDLPRREVMRQQAPGTPTADDIEDPMQDVALGVLLWSSPALGFRDLGLEQFPLLVADVGRVRFSGFHTLKINASCSPVGNFLNTL
jgi:hypothetical protein